MEPPNIVNGRAVNEAIRSRTSHCLASSALVAMRPTASAAPP